MKKITAYLMVAVMFLFVAALAACKKNATLPPAVPSSSLVIVNAIPGSAPLLPNFKANNKLQYYSAAVIGTQAIPANGALEYGGYVGDYLLSLAQSTDTLRTVYKGNISLAPNGFHSLFLTGTLATPDSFFTVDNIKPVTDSVVNVRFVNICTGSVPVSVNLQATPATPIVTGVAFKTATAFIPFPAVKPHVVANRNYTFQIKETATGKLLATYALPVFVYEGNPAIETSNKVFKNLTIVYKGVANGFGASAPGIILVKNY